MPRAPVLHQLRVVVPDELSDAVSDFLLESGAEAVDASPLAAGVAVRSFGAKAALSALAARLAPFLVELGVSRRAVIGPARDTARGWQTAFTEYLEPVRVSPTLLLLPGHAAPPAARAERVIRLAPAFAFGFGDHATTRLAARAVERCCRRGGHVLDVGTGTGVLALVAASAGADRVTGIDVEAPAVAAARRNARNNGLSRICRFSRTPLERLAERFDLVVANVDFRTHAELSPAMPRVMAPGGVLLVAGMLCTWGGAKDESNIVQQHGCTWGGEG
jgi:ribosomal protein L11 methyltransferase